MTGVEREVLRRAAERPGALLREVVETEDQARALVHLVRGGAVRLTRSDPPRIASVNQALVEVDLPAPVSHRTGANFAERTEYLDIPETEAPDGPPFACPLEGCGTEVKTLQSYRRHERAHARKAAA